MDRLFLTTCLLVLAAPFSTAVTMYGQKVCDVHAYGAKGDGVTKDTAAIQAAIDDCARSRGVVRLAGSAQFLTAPLHLRSGITLEIAQGTTLAGSTDHADYPAITEFRMPGRQALLSAKNAHDITIDGGGTIDGQGESWWGHRHDESYVRPRLIVFDHCTHVQMHNITVENSPMWQIVPYYSSDLTFRNMTVRAPQHSPNTDGIDPFSSTHVLIENVHIDTGDDDVAIKSGQPGSPGPDSPSQYITIRNCNFDHGHGLSVGSEVSGGVQHVLAEHITFNGTDNGIRVKSNRDRGADISDLVYRDITLTDVKTPVLISMFYPKIPASISAAPVTRLTPHFHDITLTNVKATGAVNTAIIVGLPEAPIRNLRLDNVSLSGQKGAVVEYANVTATHFVVKPASGSAIQLGPGVTGNLR